MFTGIDGPNLVWFLALLVFGGVSFLIWTKGKTPAALLMTIGFAVMFLIHLFAIFNVFKAAEFPYWMFTLGFGVAAFGFGLTFWTKIKDDIAHIKSGIKDKLASAASKGDGADS